MEMSLMLSNNHKNVKGVKGMLRVQTATLNTLKATHIKQSNCHVKPVKGFSRVRAREENSQQILKQEYIKNKNISTREKYTLNTLNSLTNLSATSLSNVKGTNRTLNTLNINKNKV